MKSYIKSLIASVIFLVVGICLWLWEFQLGMSSDTLQLAVILEFLSKIAFVLSFVLLCAGVAIKVIEVTKK